MNLRFKFFNLLGYLFCELAFRTDCWGPFALSYRVGCWFYTVAARYDSSSG